MKSFSSIRGLTIAGICIASLSGAWAAPAAKPAPKPTTAAPKTYPVSTTIPTYTGEDYKSFHPMNNFTFGGSAGMGLVDTHAGFTLIGNIAAKVVKDGFIPDIVNPVFLEAEFGPTFVSGATFWQYSTHLRWDFVKDAKWTLFALGGFGGNFGSNKYGDRMALYPRFGVGAFYALDTIDLRFEFSHEMITVGASVPF
jgi:hypothetical protein